MADDALETQLRRLAALMAPLAEVYERIVFYASAEAERTPGPGHGSP